MTTHIYRASWNYTQHCRRSLPAWCKTQHECLTLKRLGFLISLGTEGVDIALFSTVIVILVQQTVSHMKTNIIS